MRKQFYVYNIPIANVASDGDRKATQRIDGEADFQIEAMFGEFWNNADGVPIPREPYPGSLADHNDLGFMHEIGLEFEVDSGKFMDGPVPASLLLSTPTRPLVFADRPVIRAGKTLGVKVTNNIANVAVRGHIALHGYKLFENQG
ncbi:MAG: hypothetical protein AAFP26_01065 [Planctomycetota bacterium]